jgi:hypothetical protein
VGIKVMEETLDLLPQYGEVSIAFRIESGCSSSQLTVASGDGA